MRAEVEDELLRRRRERMLDRKLEILGWPKWKVMSELLSVGAVMVFFDPRRPDCQVPMAWRQRSHVDVSIRRGQVEALGRGALVAWMMHEEQETRIRLAWRWVYSLVGEGVGGVVWRGDAPRELRRELRPEPDAPVRIG